MGILRATKYKTFLKLSAAVFLLSIILVTGLIPSLHTGAISPVPTLQITWIDNAHSKAVDNSGNAYLPINYLCGTVGTPTFTNGNGTAVGGDAVAGNKVTASVETETGSNVNKKSVPGCGNYGTVSAGYVWVSNNAPHYALIVHTPSSSNLDTRQCPVTGTKNGCKADVWKIDANGNLVAPAIISSAFAMKVDPTRVGLPIESTATDLASATETPSCESTGVTLAWIVCPIITGLSNAVDGIFNNVITPMLQEDTNQESDVWIKTKAAWSAFRVYGDIFLVIALLVVVFGQSIGGGLIDAYSAKKILPRLLLVAVLINISYYLVVFLIDVVNVVGGGLISLITQPFGFSGADAFTLTPNGGMSVVMLGGLGAGVIAASVGSAAFLGWLWPFVLLPALLTFIAILITVLLRRGLIILLIIISPIAFALYVLPNTEKYFKQWWDMLFKTLLVYPIIVALFALSKIMSVLIAAGGGSGGVASTFSGILAVIALLVPLFLIPFAFKISGGIIGQASQAFNGLSKQAHKKMLGDPRDPNSMGAKGKNRLGERYADKGMTGRALGARLNPTTMFGEKRRQQRKDNLAVIRSAQLDKYSKQVPSDEIAAANMYNDDFLLAGADMDLAKSQLALAEKEYKTKPTTELAANIASRRRGIAAASKVHGSGSAASRVAFLDALTKSGYKIAYGQEGYEQLSAMVKSITAGDEGARTQLMNGSQFNLKNAGRFDLAGINNGTSYDFELGMSKANGYSAGQSKKESFIAGAAHYIDNTAVLDGKTKDSASVANIIRSKVALDPTNATKIGKWHAQLLEDQQSATGANKDEITKQLNAINESLSPSSVVDPNTGNPVEPSPGENALAQIVRSNYEQYRRNSVDPNILNETK